MNDVGKENNVREAGETRLTNMVKKFPSCGNGWENETKLSLRARANIVHIHREQISDVFILWAKNVP